MDEQRKKVVKVAAAVALLAIAGVLGWARMHRVLDSGEEGVRSYYYDQSEKKLYAAPRYTVPPDAGIGGEPNDGVRAIVIASRAERNDPAKRRIAYLQTYTPELAKTLREVQAAKREGRKYDGKAPAGDSPYVLKNTLIRRESDAKWYEMTSAEARKITGEWQNERDADGQIPVVCTP